LMSFSVINIASVSESWSEAVELSDGGLRVAQCIDLCVALVFWVAIMQKVDIKLV